MNGETPILDFNLLGKQKRNAVNQIDRSPRDWDEEINKANNTRRHRRSVGK
jgi:hypothetical protein